MANLLANVRAVEGDSVEVEFDLTSAPIMICRAEPTQVRRGSRA